MKDLTSSATKEYNWNLVVQELKKFGIRMTKEQKAQLVGGKHSLMHDILQSLYDYDQNLLAHAPAQSPYRAQDNNSEMNYGGEFPPLEKGHGRYVKDSDSQAPQRDQNNFLLNSRSSAQVLPILAVAPTKKSQLDPLVGRHRKSPISQDHDGFPDIQSFSSPNLNISLAYPDDIILDPNYQGSRVGLSECNSTLEFILEGLSQSLGMTQSQAATLLANSQKYLMHMCVKGMKGNDFQKLIGWYKLTIQFAPKLVELLDYEKNDIKALAITFNVLKCGLFSSNAEVVNITGRALNKIQSHINSDAQHLQLMVWEWLTTSQSLTPGNPSKKGKQTKAQKDLEIMINEAGIIAFIKAHRTHQVEIVDIFSAFLVSFGRDNYIDLFTLQLKNHSLDELEYLRIIQDLLPTLVSTQKGKMTFVDSGALSIVLDMCIQICDFQLGSFTNDYRQVALQLMVQIWKQKPEVVQTQRNDGQTADTIIRILKNGCRDFSSKGVSQQCIHLSFYLLDSFATERNMFAPIIYKSMTFVLIESYLNLELRESLLKNFIHLFKVHQNIPVSILCEPLLKQIMINLEKQDRAVQKNQTILAPDSYHFNLNTTDFELFLSIANHPKINPSVAVPLLEIVAIIARKNIIFTRVSLKLLLIILARFENNTQIFQTCQSIITDIIKIITDQDAAKVELYNELKENPKVKNKRKGSVPTHGGLNAGVSPNTINAKYNEKKISESDKIDDTQLQAIINPRLQQDQSAYYMAMKTTERLIVNLLQLFIQTGIKVITEFTREKLLDAYIKSEKNLKFSNKGIIYLLQFFEKDVTKLLQFSKQQLARQKTLQIEEKKKQEKFLKDQAQILERARLGAINKSQDAYADIYDNLSDINQLNINVNESLEHDTTLKKQPLFSPRRNYLEVPKKTIKSKKMSLINDNSRKSLLRYRTGTKKDDDDIFDRDSHSQIYYPDTIGQRKRKSANIVKSYTNKMDFYAKDDKQIRLYEINEDSSAEQHKYLQWVKDWLKLYKAMFQKYAEGTIGKTNAPQTFENITKERNYMNLAAVFSFLQDFKVSKVEARREDVKRIIQLINIKQESNFKTTSDLDLEGFIEFNLQLGFYLYKENSIRPSKFMPILFDRFKEVSLATKTPLFQRLLENPNAPPIGDLHTIQYLTEQVNKYPEAELPAGYIKVKVDRIKEVYGPDPSIYKKESQQIAAMVLDDLYNKLFGIPLLEPMIQYEKYWTVKHDTTLKKPKPQARYYEIGEKHRFKSFIETEEEKMKKQETSLPPYKQNTKKLLHQRISTESEIPQPLTRSSQSIAIKRRNFGSVSPNTRRPLYNQRPQKEELISKALRDELAYTDPDQDAHLRESAFLLDDMIGAVSKGERKLSHRQPPIGAKINKITEDRVTKQLRDEEIKLAKEEKILKRQVYLKNKLEAYQSEKKAKEALKYKVEKETIKKQKDDSIKKEQKKKAYYEQLQKEFEEKRLPQIAQNKAKEQELKQLLQEENKRKKLEAQRKIDENTQSLRRQFTEAAKLRERSDERSQSQLDKVQRFDTLGKPVSPRRQTDIERLKLAKSTTYKQPQNLKVIKDLGPPPKNLKEEKQRLGLEKKSNQSPNKSPNKNQIKK